MKLPMMPKNLKRVADDEEFHFACHPGVTCFTHCCRHLELSLTPYDVLRLKNALKMSSADFLDRYVIIEHDDDDIFPRFYLTMVDDGNVSCVFVNQEGCTVYNDRPGACRAYPMGRASMRKEQNLEEFYVLLKEDHCKGFEETLKQSPLEYSRDQGLDLYNHMNDAIISIQQHEKIRQGMRPNREQVELYTLCLYDLDTFRKNLADGTLNPSPDSKKLQELENDEALLLFGVEWLKQKLFES